MIRTTRNPMRHQLANLIFASCLTVLTSQSVSAVEGATIIELSAESSRSAPNDLILATVLTEAAGTNPGDLSRQVNKQMADALKITKVYQSVKTKSGNTNSYPVYAKGGKIESWRMRSELLLESSDTEAISELLGKLQNTLAIANLVLQPSAETRKTAENQAILEAIASFKARATIIAGTFNKSYRIKQLSVSSNGRIIQPMYRAATKSMSFESVSVPMESGESQISATVSGQIELE